MKRKKAVSTNESGQISLLTIGFAVLALAIVLLVSTAASIHLERKRLLYFTDLASLEAINTLAANEITTGPLTGSAVDLSGGDLHGIIHDRIRTPQNANEEFTNIRLGPKTSITGPASIQVHFIAEAQPLFIPWSLIPWTDGVEIHAVVQTHLS